MSKFFDGLKDKAKNVKEGILDRFNLFKGDWPQTMTQPPYNVKGFLPPQLIRPTLRLTGSKDKEKSPTFKGLDEDSDGVEIKEPGGYVYTDWMGYKITDNPTYKQFETRTTAEKFNLGVNIPKPATELEKEPYSTRDTLILYNDSTQDYFKHSLQVVDGLNTDFPTYQPLLKGEGSTSRLYNFMNKVQTTPYENNDPVMFGFELIIDSFSSPLLNGSIYDFLDNIGSTHEELAARKTVYEDFKNQFKKIFKTKGTVRVDEANTRITNFGSNPATLETRKGIYNPGKRAYMSYYLKKVSGLENLTEKNTPGEKKYLIDYKKDVLKFDFYEDVSLTLGTLAHLYKLLYWSKPNGKHMIPENLLRFNCDLVVSECRNFNRTRKAVETGHLEIIKDNVSRYIYSLRECQFYFDSYTHPGDIDMSGPSTTESYTIQMDYKYSAVKLERWMPYQNNFGVYVGYNNGALWKIGNVGSDGRGSSYSTSVPRFLTLGGNSLLHNGVTKPLVVKNDFKVVGKEDPIPNPNSPELNFDTPAEAALDKLKNFGKTSLKKAKEMAKQSGQRLLASVLKEGQNFINQKFALLNESLNKIEILNASLGDRISEPKNIYTGQSLDLRGRLFYDVRGELINFIGGFTGNQLAGQTSTGTIVVPPRPPKPNPLAQANLASQRSFSFANLSGDVVRYDQSAQQNYGTSDFMKIQFPFYGQRFPPPIT